MFEKHLKYVIALTALALLTYTLPTVRAAIGTGYLDSVSNVAAVGSSQAVSSVSVKNITAKVSYDSRHKESGIVVTSKVQVYGGQSGVVVPGTNAFYAALNNKTVKVNGASVVLAILSSSISKDTSGSYTIRAGKSATFELSGKVSTGSMIAGQYTASLVTFVSTDSKFPVPTNKSNTIVVVGENSPYITNPGKGIYGTSDTVILNSVRAGKNATMTITSQSLPSVCPVGAVCPPTTIFSKTFKVKTNDKSGQIKFKLSDYAIPAGSHILQMTNMDLGQSAGKSNILSILVLNQSKITTAVVSFGKLALTYDANQNESSLAASYEIKIKAGSKDLTFDSRSFGIIANSSNYGSYATVTLRTVNGVSASFPYILKAGKEGKFLVTASVNPRNLVAGSYAMTLDNIFTIGSNVNYREIIRVPANVTTNSVVVVGEISPYINSIDPNPAVAGDKLGINGIRLNDSTAYSMGSVYIDGSIMSGVDGSKDGSILFFTLPASTTDGYHVLTVKNANGASNNYYFESKGGVVLPPTPICPVGYVCSTPGTNPSCPEGFTCTVVTENCPSGFVCTVQAPIGQVPSYISFLNPGANEIVAWDKPYQITWGGNWGGHDTFSIIEYTNNTKNTITRGLTQNQAGCSGVGKQVCGFTWTPQNIGSSQLWIVKENGTGKEDQAFSGNFRVSSSTVPTTPLIVNSPNGGETWVKNQIQYIKWSDNVPTPICPVGYTCPVTRNLYDINLISTVVPCTSNTCPVAATYVIASGVINSDPYPWTVGKTVVSSSISGMVADGSYTVQICRTGTKICDVSYSFFNIVSAPVATPSIKVISPNGGEKYLVNDVMHIRWSSANLSPNASVQIALEDTTQSGDTPAHFYYITRTMTIPNSGLFDWKITPSQYMSLVSGNVYKINVSSSEGMSVGSIGDSSDLVFSIKSVPPAPVSPTLSLQSASFTPVVGHIGDSTAKGNFTFKVDSPNGDVKIDRLNTANFVSVVFNGRDLGAPSATTFNALDNGSPVDSSQYLVVREGETRSFSLDFVVTPTQGTGYYKVNGSYLKLDGSSVGFGPEFTTSYVMLNSSKIIEI